MANRLCIALLSVAVLLGGRTVRSQDAPTPFGIQVIDEATGRGVPLVELKTTDHRVFLTDSAGWVALAEPDLMGIETYFHVRSHGYEHAKDGFGYAGVRLVPRPGERATVKVTRLNVAERLYRITGAGLYRDSVLLGLDAPISRPLISAGVTGQDSVQPAVFRDQVYWFWGDTSFTRYPLGNFRTTGAVSDLPGRGGLDPSVGVDLRYFETPDGFTRELCPLERAQGPVWIDGVVSVPDASGRERLVCRYARMKDLGEMLEQGIAEWDEEAAEFRRVARLDLDATWRFPHGHPVRPAGDGGDVLLFGHPLPNVRVPARYEALLDPSAYEAWGCTDAEGMILRGADGAPAWGWRGDGRPVNPPDEKRWLDAGDIRPEEARGAPADVETGRRVTLHGGTVRWNEHRKRWILVALEVGGSSFLGEVWYSEAPEPTGPWLRARKVVTHDDYSFYNPAHHDFFDQEGGRIIYFEGTYASTFSGTKTPTPMYDYNQVMYRLDLDDPRLRAVGE